jgi:hypothetical protein
MQLKQDLSFYLRSLDVIEDFPAQQPILCALQYEFTNYVHYLFETIRKCFFVN